jgi:hypothetical protein
MMRITHKLSKSLNTSIIAAMIVLVMTSWSRGAILDLEDFNGGANGWATRDGIMAVDNAVNGYLLGDFGPAFFPQTDAFRIDSGTHFVGDYTTPGITQIRFSFTAVNVLPSDLFIRIIDGANVFSYQFNPVSFSATYVVDLAWSFGWNGLSESAFNTALTSVDAVEIQVTRSGNASQSYQLDNVETLDTDIGGGGPGGGPSAVPEPQTLTLLLLAGVALFTVRRHALQKLHVR